MSSKSNTRQLGRGITAGGPARPKCMQGSALCAVLILGISQLHAAQVVYQKQVPANPLAVDPAGNVYYVDGATITKLDAAGNVLYTKSSGIGVPWTRSEERRV